MTPYDGLLEAVYKLLLRSRGLPERDARLVAGWSVFTILYGEGDALAGAVVSTIIRREGVRKTLGALADVARRYGVRLDAIGVTLGAVTPYTWYHPASKLVNAILAKLSVRDQVYEIVTGRRMGSQDNNST